MIVANEPAGEKVSLDEDLETVANSEDGHSLVRRLDDFAHDGGMSGDRATAQIITVGKPAGQDDCVDVVQVVVAVPE